MALEKKDWPGIDAKWKSGWKAHYKNQLKWFDTSDRRERDELEYYASTGQCKVQPSDHENSAKYRQWEGLLSYGLVGYGLLRAFELEAKAVRERQFDYQAASSAFAAGRLAQMIYMHIHIKAPERLGSGICGLDISLLPFTALGVIIGEQSAFELARLVIAAYRRGWYRQDDRRPVFTFMLLLLADFLEEDIPPSAREFLGNSPLAPLLAAWNTPSVADIGPLCIAACDFHTRRCNYREDYDFSDGSWWYTPVEIMLLFRLRTLRGLANPELDHPLWNNAFADSADKVPVVQDELVQRVQDRMRTDGYDEAFIARGTLTV